MTRLVAQQDSGPKDCPICSGRLTRSSQVLSGAARLFVISCPKCGLMGQGATPLGAISQFSMLAVEELSRPPGSAPLNPVTRQRNQHQQYLAEQHQQYLAEQYGRDQFSPVIREWNRAVEQGKGEKNFVPLGTPRPEPPPKRKKKEKAEKVVAQLDESMLLPVVPWVLDPDED